MAPELIRRTRAVLPNVRLVQGYGLSETGFLTALLDKEHTPDKLTSCGRPCPGIDVRVVDQSGTEVSAGQPGELVARGANVMRGYWKDPEETTRAFRNGLFRTGDLGYQDALERILVRVMTQLIGRCAGGAAMDLVLGKKPDTEESRHGEFPDGRNSGLGA